MSLLSNEALVINLCAVVFSVDQETPKMILVQKEGLSAPSLPSGIFIPRNHRSLEAGLKLWVEEQTGIELDYIEQLYTFGNRFRSPEAETEGKRLLTLSYLALSQPNFLIPDLQAEWFNCYDFFPWEDHRKGPPIILKEIRHKLGRWAKSALTNNDQQERKTKVEVFFGYERWNSEHTLNRFELLYEAGLIGEAKRDWFLFDPDHRCELPISHGSEQDNFPIIENDITLTDDHRRIAAAAMARLRGKIKYRPLIFELMPPKFTLFQIQKTVEALSGVLMHKQNFRRLLLTSGLVKETGEYDTSSPGRPALLYTFKPKAYLERSFLDLKYPIKKLG